MIPPTLALRREHEDLPDKVDRLRTEREVREYVAEINERVHKARLGLMGGPPVLLPPFDGDEVVAGWRKRHRT